MHMDSQKPDFISLRNDLLFHMVFTRNAEALKGLLSVLLSIPVTEITEIEVLNPMQYSKVIDTKLTVLDLKVHLNGERFVLVEMQVRRFPHWTNRSLTYASRQIADQVHARFNYGKLEPVILISIMNHTLFPVHPRFFAKYVLRDEEGYPYSDKLRFYVMDLTQIGKATAKQVQQGMVAWANAFHADSWEAVNKIENKGVQEAAKTMQLILSNPTERDLIRARMDAEIDWRTMLSEERDAGRLEGRQEGRQEGYIEVLANLVRDGILTVQAAAQRAGLSEADFEKRAQQLL